jgi:DegV family protein with EDD domain
MSIAIVTDSTADIPSDIAHEHQIHVVPNIMVVEGQSVEDGVGMSRQEFYARMPHMQSMPTTATHSPGAYELLYERLLSQGASQILSIHAASVLSGIYNSASTAAAVFSGRVHVEDSEQLSLGLGFQVLEAAEAIARGMTLDEVLERVRDVRQRVRVFAMLDTLEYIHRSGRVSWARARLGNLLSIKPFIELRAGRVLRVGNARTRRKGVDRLKQFLKELGALEKLAILHTNAESDALQLLEELKPGIPPAPLIVNITTIIGVHLGPNGLGFSAVVK